MALLGKVSASRVAYCPPLKNKKNGKEGEKKWKGKGKKKKKRKYFPMPSEVKLRTP